MELEGEDSDLDGNLQGFLTDWKEELRTGGGQSLGKREPVHHHLTSGHVGLGESPAMKRLPTVRDDDPPPILVIPGVPDGHCPNRPQRQRPKDQGATPVPQGGARLVDTLIADWDEINTVPFFDVELPREIAVIIFGFLAVKDLCHCSMVSRSWRELAEDNLLWYRLYLMTTSNPTIQPDSPVQWKAIVQDMLLQKKQVKRNWNERICGLSDHQPDDCRVLCCISYFEGTVLSCHSSGTVYVWDLSSDLGPVQVKQIPGPYLSSEPTCCDLKSPWAAVGTSDGCLKIIDSASSAQVYSLSDLGSVDSVSVSCRDGHLAVGVASNHSFHPSLSVLVASHENTWERIQLPLENGSLQLMKVKVMSSQQCVVYSTSTSLTLHPLHSPPTHVLSSLGGGLGNCVGCFDTDKDMTTVGCGTSAFGYQVQLFDLPSGASRSSLKGHGQPVTCISLFSPHMVASGSADKRVRVYDCRCPTPFPMLTLKGHGGCVKCVQMDQWKVVSGSADGMLVVWDQRMAGELWRTHERHSVDYCSFDDCYLACGYVPLNKHPIRPVRGENPNICHRRSRGVVRVMDFSVDPLFYTKKLPSICSSNYDEPSASFFNLDLRFPYDVVS